MLWWEGQIVFENCNEPEFIVLVMPINVMSYAVCYYVVPCLRSQLLYMGNRMNCNIYVLSVQEAAEVRTVAFHPGGDFILVGTNHPTCKILLHLSVYLKSINLVMWRLWVKAPSKTPLFPWARNFTLIAKYWLVPGMDSSMISQSN